MEKDPILLFRRWLEMASESEINDPTAMSLATCTKDGRPSVRMVLLKETNENGFKFHTNSDSRKGCELKDNPYAALCFHWKSLRKQVRVEGKVKMVSKIESDMYYKTRPYGRKIGGWASLQSRPLEDIGILEERVKIFEEKFKDYDDVPRPENWNGYRIVPDLIEFWDQGENRLHTRYEYKKTKDGWIIRMLYP